MLTSLLHYPSELSSSSVVVRAATVSSFQMFPINYKTVLVLDRTPKFEPRLPSLTPVDNSKAPHPPGKSLWMCGVEACLEYCGIVWRQFPRNKHIRMIASDTSERCFNSWDSAQQSSDYLISVLREYEVLPVEVSKSTSYSITHGLQAAVTALCEPTQAQLESNKRFSDSFNCGRIICITSIDPETSRLIEEKMDVEISERNRAVTSSDTLAPIDFCEFVLINLTSATTSRHYKRTASHMNFDFHSISVVALSAKMASLVIEHYDLYSTTITGIPMKTGPGAVSMPYSVELLHTFDLHGSGNRTEGRVMTKLGYDHDTTLLTWRLDKKFRLSHEHSKNIHLMSPAQVYSHPSLSLINFLNNGNTATLDSVMGRKITTHLLSIKPPNIYLHFLDGFWQPQTESSRKIRFSQLLRDSNLPLWPDSHDTRIVRTFSVDCCNRIWPRTESGALIFGDERLKTLLIKVMEHDLQQSDMEQCKRCIQAVAQDQSVSYGKYRAVPILNTLSVFLEQYQFSKFNKQVFEYLRFVMRGALVPWQPLKNNIYNRTSSWSVSHTTTTVGQQTKATKSLQRKPATKRCPKKVLVPNGRTNNSVVTNNEVSPNLSGSSHHIQSLHSSPFVNGEAHLTYFVNGAENVNQQVPAAGEIPSTSTFNATHWTKVTYQNGQSYPNHNTPYSSGTGVNVSYAGRSYTGGRQVAQGAAEPQPSAGSSRVAPRSQGVTHYVYPAEAGRPQPHNPSTLSPWQAPEHLHPGQQLVQAPLDLMLLRSQTANPPQHEVSARVSQTPPNH